MYMYYWIKGQRTVKHKILVAEKLLKNKLESVLRLNISFVRILHI